MAKYHINPNTGDAGKCSAEKGKCPFGGDSEHFPTPEAARQAFEESHSSFDSALKRMSPESALEYERDAFFSDHKKGQFTVIEKGTGYVLSDNLYVFESPEDGVTEEESEEFLEKAVAIQEVRDLSAYTNPMVYEGDTGAIASARNLYAVDQGKQEIDFEEILDSDSAADELAEEKGFKLWD